MSSNEYNTTTGFIQVCSITSAKKKKRAGFILLSKDHEVHGYINSLQIKDFDFIAPEREVTFIEKATAAELGMTTQIVKVTFNFDELIGNKKKRIESKFKLLKKMQPAISLHLFPFSSASIDCLFISLPLAFVAKDFLPR